MNGLILINKPKVLTSRDVVNKVSKCLQIKKVGHTGTLDPLATGLLVLTIGNATKITDIITFTEKEYICSAKVGIQTDTLDITGEILEEKLVGANKEELEQTLNSFKGKYDQQVPAYSAVRLKGKRLYEYAREGIKVELPSRKVEIKEIELLDFNTNSFKFKCLVSKGTYIRSLVRDIGNKLNIPMTMEALVRTKQGEFNLEDAYTLEDIENGKYKTIPMEKALSCYKQITADKELEKDISHGKILDNTYNEDIMIFLNKEGKVIAIYERYKKDKNKIKPKNVFI